MHRYVHGLVNTRIFPYFVHWEGLEENTPVKMSLSSACILVSWTISCTWKQGSLEKWLTIGLEQEIHKMCLEHFCSARKSKSAHKQTHTTWWGYVKETQPTERAPSGWKLEQFEQQNKWFCIELQLQYKINIHETLLK